MGGRDFFISTVSVAEILFGVAALPAGKRRSRLADAFESAIERLFEDRILSFDLAAPRAYAALMSAARSFLRSAKDAARG